MEMESSKDGFHVVASSFWRIRKRILAARAEMGVKVDLNSASSDEMKRKMSGLNADIERNWKR